MTKKCPNCNADLEEHALICEYCGTKFSSDVPKNAGAPERKRYCTSCGKELLPDASFCRFCGARRDAASAPASAAPNRNAAPNRTDPPYRSAPPTGTPAPMQPGGDRRARAERGTAESAAKPKKGDRALSLFLALTLAIELCIAGFRYPGFLKKVNLPGIVTGRGDGEGDSGEITAEARELLDSLGITQEQLEMFRGLEIEATPENSPGNPRFIEARFTDADYRAAESQSAAVSRENPTADFPSFGIHVDLKSWNLDSEEDTLTVRKLPLRTDEATGCELYAYDYSLASGQHEFYTDVEITVPLQGDPAAFDGVLYYNESADVWEDAYCELSEDGGTYTLYASHFSTDAERTDLKLKELAKQVQAGLSRFTDTNGTIFRILPEEYPSKYPNSKTFLYKVGIRGGWKIDTFFSQQTAESLALYEALMKKTGGVPAEAGSAEGWGLLGGKMDAGASAQTAASVYSENAKVGQNITGSVGWDSINAGITIIGLWSLMMRCLDQWQRGVAFEDIIKSNKWNFVSAAVSAAGLFMTACKYIGVATVAGVSTAKGATVLAIVGAAIFACTKIDAAVTEAYEFNHPLGQPKTIEDGAYYYFLSDYGWDSSRTEETQPGDAAAYALLRLIESDPTEYDDSHAPAYHRLDIRGNGWAFALSYLFEKYRDDPEKLEKKVKQLCDDFIERFWSDDIRPSVRYDCWKKAVQKMLDEDHETDYYGHYRKFEGDSSGFAVVLSDEDHAKSLGITLEELERRRKIQALVDSGRSIDGLFDKAAERDQYVHLDDMDEEALKEHARAVLNKNLNPIVYNLYRKYYKEAFQEILRQYREELLPLLNTRITFYMADTSVKEGQMSAAAKCDQFAFTDYEGPLFLPANKESGPHTVYTNMALERRENTPVLLETLVYHYVRAGCPTRVNVGCTEDGTSFDGVADWDGVKISADQDALYAGTEPRDWENWSFWEVWKLFTPGGLPVENETVYKRLRTVKDMKVPIVYTTPADRTYTIRYNANTSFHGGRTNSNLRMVYEKFAYAFTDPDSPVSLPSGAISENGEVNFTQELRMTWAPEHYDDSGSASIQVRITGKIDPKAEEGICSLSGTGKLSIHSVNGGDDTNWNFTMTFSGEGRLTSGGKAKPFAEWTSCEVRIDGTTFRFTGTVTGEDAYGNPIDWSYDEDYSDSGAWSAAVVWQ